MRRECYKSGSEESDFNLSEERFGQSRVDHPIGATDFLHNIGKWNDEKIVDRAAQNKNTQRR